MIVVTNRIPVAAGFESQFEARFRERAGLVDESPGFVRNEVHRIRPVRFERETSTWREEDSEGAVFEVKTWWRAFDDFVAWTKSPSFREAHADRPPKEMFSGPSELVVAEVTSSTAPSTQL